jgi:hypothetical protein
MISPATQGILGPSRRPQEELAHRFNVRMQLVPGADPLTRERIAEAEGIKDKRRYSPILARVPRPRQYDSQ